MLKQNGGERRRTTRARSKETGGIGGKTIDGTVNGRNGFKDKDGGKDSLLCWLMMMLGSSRDDEMRLRKE